MARKPPAGDEEFASAMLAIAKHLHEVANQFEKLAGVKGSATSSELPKGELPGKPLYSIAELCKRWGVKQDTIEDLISDEKLAVVRVDGDRRRFMHIDQIVAEEKRWRRTLNRKELNRRQDSRAAFLAEMEELDGYSGEEG